MKQNGLNLREEILKEHSKKQTAMLASYIGNDPEKFAELMRLFTGDEYRITQRAAWIVSYCAQNFPGLIVPYLPALVQLLGRPVHDAVKRNTVRILQFQEIPGDLRGELVEACFGYFYRQKNRLLSKLFL
jgi:hypothetical protein